MGGLTTTEAKAPAGRLAASQAKFEIEAESMRPLFRTAARH